MRRWEGIGYTWLYAAVFTQLDRKTYNVGDFVRLHCCFTVKKGEGGC